MSNTPLGLRLDYCNVILAGLSISTLAPLQRVLRVAARVVLDIKPRSAVAWCRIVQT